MDWRSGSRQNPTGSAFRGITTRGRGRGRGRGGPSNDRGGYASNPAEPVSAPPTPSLASGQTTTPSLNLPPKGPSRRNSHQQPRRTPSLTHLDLPKASTPPTDQPATPGGRPQITRRASHNPPGVSQSPPSNIIIPSLKLDPSTPAIPGSPRPKSARKRSHNRTRSSSKASTQGQLSATPSIASFRDKETPPHLAQASAPPDVQSFDLRTNIDTLVERVRAMAMAGSAADRDKDREGHYTPSEGHIDWAGDEDDTLPDLDDWVRPKSAEPREADNAQSDEVFEKHALSPVEEVISLGPPTQDKRKEQPKEKRSEVDGKDKSKRQRTEDAKEVKEVKATNEVNSNKEKEAPNKTKTRGKHGRKKGSTSEGLPTETRAPINGAKHISPEPVGEPEPVKIRSPLVHPLPPKPTSAATPTRGSKSRGASQITPHSHSVAQVTQSISQELHPSASPSDKLSQPSLAAPVKSRQLGENTAASTCAPETGVKKRAFDPSIDWAKAPRPSGAPNQQRFARSEEPVTSEPEGKKRAFDPAVDWANAPSLVQIPSPAHRSPTQPTPSSKRPGQHHSPPRFPPPDRGRPHSPSPSVQTAPPRIFPAHVHAKSDAPSPAHTRSQMNSPERSPRRLREREGPTHLRTHSSPQTGPGTRTHASRPVITLDAISRISRTLGVPGTTTPPRGQAVGVTAID